MTGDSLDTAVSYTGNLLTINSGADVTISGKTSNDTIKVADNANVKVTFSNLEITTASTTAPFDCGNDTIVNISLAQANKLTASGNTAALSTTPTSGLTITSAEGDGKTSGTLEATGVVGIGNSNGTTGEIFIQGGTITAQGSAVGIGDNASGTIAPDTITYIQLLGGIVTAKANTGFAIGSTKTGGFNAKIGNGAIVNASSQNESAIGANTSRNGEFILEKGVLIVSGYGTGKEAVQGFRSTISTGIYFNIPDGTGKVYGNTIIGGDVTFPAVSLSVPDNTEITVNPNVAVKSQATVTCGANAGFVLKDGASYTNDTGGSLSMQLSYDAGDGATPITPQTVKLGEAYTAANLPTPESTNGLYFTGWYTSEAATGTPIAVGETINSCASYTLYAGYSTEPPVPDEPDVPDTPDTPDVPEEPSEPTVTPPDSAEPEGVVAAASEPASDFAPVQTGDATGLGALAALALSAAAVTLVKRKKH